MQEAVSFRDEMETLRKERGQPAVAKAYRVFVAMLRWLRTYGWGNITVSCLEHIFKGKIKAEAFIKVEEDE